MKEKITKVQKIEEIVTYVSNDGIEFETESECIRWEQRGIKDKIKELIYQIPHVKSNGYDSYLRCGTEDDEVLILRPRNIEDINNINYYLELCESKIKLDDNAIGNLFILALDYDNYIWYADMVETYLNIVQKTYKQFEEKLNSL